MSESAWVDTSQVLTDLLLAKMGKGGAYSNLVVCEVHQSIVRDVRDWEGWDLPALVVVGQQARRLPGPHGAGRILYEKEYPFVIVSIVEGDPECATRDARILMQRVEDALTLNTIALPADSPEKVMGPVYLAGTNRVGGDEVQMYRKPSAKADQRFGVGFSMCWVRTKTKNP